MSSLIKFDPFAEMQALQKQFFSDDLMAPIKRMQVPTTDVYTEDNKRLVVEAHLPYFEEENIDIHVDRGTLIISAEKHEEEKDKKKKYVIRESSSSFYRQIRLPEVADQDAIEASMKKGVLKVIVPFKELPTPKKISIKK